LFKFFFKEAAFYMAISVKLSCFGSCLTTRFALPKFIIPVVLGTFERNLFEVEFA
jgi:hypothetical protein